MRQTQFARNSAPYFALLILAVAFTSPLFKNLHNTGANDWDYFCFSNEVARETIMKYHQFPLWNPFAAGGLPLHANPQSAFLRPAFILSLFFGCVIGLKIEVLLTVMAGMIGMFLLAKHYKMHPIAGVLTASIFGLSSFFSLHIAEGHATFFAFYLLPYIFLFYLKSLDQERNMLYAAIFIVLVIFAGAAFNVLPQASIFLLTYGIFSAFQKKNFWPILSFVFIFLIVFFLGSIKIIPTLEYLFEHPRPMESSEVTPIKGIYHVFLNRIQVLGAHHMEPQTWGWHEFGAYTGIFPLILFMIGLWYFWKKEVALILSGIFAFFISLGDFSPISPWHLMHKMPLLESLHVPSRYIVIFIFCLAIVCGLSLDMILKSIGNRKSKYLLLAILVFVIIDLLSVNSKTFTQAFPNQRQNILRNVDFQQMNGPLANTDASSAMYFNLLANRGILNVYEPVPHQTFAKGLEDQHYKGEIHLDSGGNTSYRYWSPNKLIVRVQTENSTRVVINQNFDKGWRVKGGVAEDFNGLLSTNVSAGTKEVEFYYLPVSFVIGAIISLISAVCVFLLLASKSIYERLKGRLRK